jgi:hypothetical protein
VALVQGLNEPIFVGMREAIQRSLEAEGYSRDWAEWAAVHAGFCIIRELSETGMQGDAAHEAALLTCYREARDHFLTVPPGSDDDDFVFLAPSPMSEFGDE